MADEQTPDPQDPQAQPDASETPEAGAPQTNDAGVPIADDGQPDVSALAEQALADASDAAESISQEVTGSNVDLPNFQQVLADVEATGIKLLHDVELNVKVELGRTGMVVEDVLKLAEGSVVELDKLAGDPVDVWVNERLVARGEVLVLNDCFCVRVSEILSEAEQESEETPEGDVSMGTSAPVENIETSDDDAADA